MEFELVSPFSPTGDQPDAIAELSRGVIDGVPAQTLLVGQDLYNGQCHRESRETNSHPQSQ